MNVEQKLSELGLILPSPSKPAGSYQPWIIERNLLFISGQFPIENGQLRFMGRVGIELTEEQGHQAARLAGLNVLAQIRSALGGFDRLVTLARVEGHVASAPDWNNAPPVLDGASNLFNVVLGERGRHTRTAFTRIGYSLRTDRWYAHDSCPARTVVPRRPTASPTSPEP